MTVLLLAALVVVLLVVMGIGVFVFALARSSKAKAVASATIPGVDVAVPASWAGSHDPEARLHRRIRDAVAALDATIGTSGVAQIDDRAKLMVSAQELDQRLVTIWALPKQAKPQPLAEAEQGVAALESAATAVALAPGDGAVGRVRDAADGIGRYATPPEVPNPIPDQPAADRREPPTGIAE